MATLPKIEARHDVPAAGWTFTISIGAGDVTVTIPTATYYHSTAGSGSRSLIAELAYQLSNTSGAGGPYTVALSATTGLVTVTRAGGNFALTFGGDYQQWAFGFAAASYSGAATYTGTLNPWGMWRPNVSAASRAGSHFARGQRDDDQVVTRSRSGRAVSTINNRYTVERFEFRGLTASKTWIENQSPLQDSAENLWESFLSAGRPFRYYLDRADDTSYTLPITTSQSREYLFAGGGFKPTRRKAGTDVLWDWSFDAYVNV